jgi:aldehyde dehydrogenase (NAD+)
MVTSRSVRASKAVRHDHWIAGKPKPPDTSAYIDTVDPATKAPGGQVAAGNATDVDDAVAAASEAQRPWAESSAAERSELLHCIADAIVRHGDQLTAAERACTGKVSAQLKLEVDMSAAYFRYYAGVLRAFGGRVIEQGADTLTYTRHEPYGVVGVITPWNLPLNQACRAIAPALASGNAVVLKPSEFTSVSTLQLAGIASASGLAPGVFNVVTGTGPEVGTPLAAHRLVRRVAFTGSVRTGRHLAAVAADRLIPLTLELGGKSPQVVFADADLDRSVAAAVSTVSFNTGQTCSAATRLLVEQSVHEEVAARVVEAVTRLQPGQDFGPMITEGQFTKVLETFVEAEKTGLKPAVGGRAYEEGTGAAGWYVQPTVYVGVDPAVRIARDEVFGPVLVTIPFTNEADAVVRANDTEYGLVASVWSGDVARGLRVAERIEAGQVAVNGGPLTIETPFGGFKRSGYGREKGLEALHDYTQTKTISLLFG